jgi:hypothetical protein
MYSGFAIATPTQPDSTPIDSTSWHTRRVIVTDGASCHSSPLEKDGEGKPT